MGKKIFANEAADKGLTPKYTSSSCRSILKKQTAQSKNGLKT